MQDCTITIAEVRVRFETKSGARICIINYYIVKRCIYRDRLKTDVRKHSVYLFWESQAIALVNTGGAHQIVFFAPDSFP